MTRSAQQAGAKVLLVGMQMPPNYGADYSNRFAGLYEKVAKAHKAALVPFLLKGVADGADPTRLFQADRIHPKEEAQPLILDNVWPELKKLLAASRRGDFPSVSVHKVPAAEAIARLDDFSAIIDARSEAEYELDHLPGALNWPSLNNEERKLIGTIYTQVSPFEAQKRGAALVAANIARHIEREVIDKPRTWQPLVYCWRGGKRSGSLGPGARTRSAFGSACSRAATRRSAAPCSRPCPSWRRGSTTA